MQQEQESVVILNKYFRRKNRENRTFSMRWLARHLEVSPSLISLVMSGKRSLNLELAERLSSLLDIDDENKQKLVKAVLKKQGLKKDIYLQSLNSPDAGLTLDWEAAPRTQFDLLKAWYYTAILDCTSLTDYDGTTEFIALKLDLDHSIVKDAFELLKRHHLLIFADGKWVKSVRFLEFSSLTQKDSIRKFHADHLENAKRVLNTQTAEKDLEGRMVTGLTITGTQQQVAEARQRIADFMQQMAKEFGSSQPDQVYHVAVQLFPLTK
jgi:uncharacterized protein (TIGR02147 family)